MSASALDVCKADWAIPVVIICTHDNIFSREKCTHVGEPTHTSLCCTGFKFSAAAGSTQRKLLVGRNPSFWISWPWSKAQGNIWAFFSVRTTLIICGFNNCVCLVFLAAWLSDDFKRRSEANLNRLFSWQGDHEFFFMKLFMLSCFRFKQWGTESHSQSWPLLQTCEMYWFLSRCRGYFAVILTILTSHHCS